MASKFDVRTVAVGTSCGLRAMTAPAVCAIAADSRWQWLLALLAVGELIGDKLPAAPSRTEPPGLIARALAGALTGRAIALRYDACEKIGIATGALAALVAARVAHDVRANLTVERGLPDWPAALLEDALALGLASIANAA